MKRCILVLFQKKKILISLNFYTNLEISVFNLKIALNAIEQWLTLQDKIIVSL